MNLEDKMQSLSYPVVLLLPYDYTSLKLPISKMNSCIAVVG